MKSIRFHLTALALIASTSLVGCGQELSTAPSISSLQTQGLSSTVIASSGKAIFENVEASAMATLSLSEIVLLTPYITGSKTPENSTLSEIVAVTPAVIKFQTAFKAEMSKLSLSEVVKVTKYMSIASKNRYPYPELGSESVVPA